MHPLQHDPAVRAALDACVEAERMARRAEHAGGDAAAAAATMRADAHARLSAALQRHLDWCAFQRLFPSVGLPGDAALAA